MKNLKKFGTSVMVTAQREGCKFVVLDKDIEDYTLYPKKIQEHKVWCNMKLYELSFRNDVKQFFLENPDDNAVYYLKKMMNAEKWRTVGGEIIYTKNGVDYEYMEDT